MTASTDKLLNATPSAIQGKDWKTFLLKHPWYPTGLLVDHFGLRKHDIDNWKARYSEVAEALRDPKTNFRMAKTPPDIRAGLKNAWRFFFEQVLLIDFNSASSALEVIKLQGVAKTDWGFLCDRRILKELPEYDKWLAEGYTQIAFIIFNIYPGADWAQRAGVLPAMFAQTSKRLTRPELANLLENIYLRFLAGLPQTPTADEINEAKRIFYLRSRESSFITTAMLRPYGLTGYMTRDGVKDIVLALRHKFAIDLGLAPIAKDNWNASKFRKLNPAIATDKCRYCQRTPVDLHHLMPRKDYPEIMFDGENVVPLCAHVHAAITRKTISPGCAEKLFAATSAWKMAKKGSKMAVFDDAMRQLHSELH